MDWKQYKPVPIDKFKMYDLYKVMCQELERDVEKECIRKGFNKVDVVWRKKQKSSEGGWVTDENKKLIYRFVSKSLYSFKGTVIDKYGQEEEMIFVVDNVGYIYTTKTVEVEGEDMFVVGDEASTLLKQGKYVSERFGIMLTNFIFNYINSPNYNRFCDGTKNDIVSDAQFKIMKKLFKFDYNFTKTTKEGRVFGEIFSYLTGTMMNEMNESSKKRLKIDNEIEYSFDAMVDSDTDA